MIGIIAGDEISTSVEEVIDWLEFLNKKWERLNGSDYLKRNKVLYINTFNTVAHPLNKYTSIWYRGFFRNRHLVDMGLADLTAKNENVIELYKIQVSELDVIRKLLFSQSSGSVFVPNLSSISRTKLEVLQIAEEAGLNIPDFLITNSKQHLQQFFALKKGKVITKPLHEISYFLENDVWYRFLTQRIKNIEKMADSFFPSLFQEQIEKMYELRVFVIGEEIYAMAIFSQNDTQTEVDFRNYNNENPNRTVPYRLPKEICSALHRLFKHLDLNNGSVDLIRANNGVYYFLEVNPLGQFGMTSKPCNYYLEKKIAEFLAKSK